MRKQRLYAVTRSNSFRASFWMLTRFFVALVAALLILVTLQRMSTRVQALRDSADRVAVAVQDEMNAARASALTLASSASAARLLGQKTPLLDTLLDMDDDLTASLSIRSSYQSIELFLLHANLVCLSTDGVQAMSAYRDRAFAETLAEGRLRDAWLAREYRLFDTTKSGAVLSYIRALPLYENARAGYIVVNLKMSALAQVARSVAIADSLSVWAGDIWIQRDAGLEALGTVEDSLRARLADGLTIGCRSGVGGDAQAIYCVHWSDLLLDSLPDARVIALALLLCCALIFAISVMLARRVTAPAKELLSRMAGAEENMESLDEDEFKLLERAFQGMTAQLAHSQRTLRENQPLLRERLIGEMLLSNDSPFSHAEARQRLGVSFPNRYFAVVILAPPESDEERRQAVLKSAEEMYRTVGEVYSTYGERNSCVFLINAEAFDGLGERLSRVSASLRASIHATLGEAPAFSIAVCDEKAPALLNAYQRARRNLLPADEADEDAVGAPLSGERVYVTAVDSHTARALSDAVIGQDAQAATALLARLREAYFPDALDCEPARKLAMQLCFHLLTTLLEQEMRISDEIVLTAIRRIGRAPDAGECVAALGEAIGALIVSKGGMTAEAREYVRLACEYVARNYMRPLTVPQIAESVHINSVYLNKLFRMAMDTTISEYLSRYRVERSLPLLADASLTIAEISARLGFSEPRGYIRNFKKFYSLTPGEYRKSGQGA